MPLLAYVLRGAITFRDDNFISGWSLTNCTSVVDFVGDLATITGTGAGSYTIMVQKAVPGSLSTNTYKYAVVRLRNVNIGTSIQLTVDHTVGSDSTGSLNSTSYGLYVLSLTAGKTIADIKVTGSATANGQQFIVDLVALCTDTPLTITNDVLDGTSVNYVAKTATLSLKLQNDPPTAKYLTSPNIINVSDMIVVWSADVFPTVGPGTAEKAFGGKIIGMTFEASKDGDAKKFLHLSAKGWGLGVERVTNSLIQLGLPSLTILNNILGQVNTAGQGWNLALNPLSVEVLSVNALDWVPEKRTAQQNLNSLSDWLAARRVAAVALNGPSDAGVDWWTSPSEAFNWFVINASGSVATYAQDPDLASVKIEQFGDPIINQVDLVGAVQTPVDGDKYTENDATNWTSTSGAVSNEATIVAVGAKSIKVLETAGTAATTQFTGDRAIAAFNPTTAGTQFSRPTLFFQVYLGSDIVLGVGGINVKLYDGGTNEADIDLAFASTIVRGQWISVRLELGPLAIDKTMLSNWHLGGTGWNTVFNKISFAAKNLNIAGVNDYFLVDGLYITSTIVEIAYDQTSINTHGLTEIVLRETAVYEPIELRRLARGHLYKWRLPTWTGPIQFTGWKSHQPDDIITLTLPDYNQTSKLYRILSVTQKFPYPYITSIEVTDNMKSITPPTSAPNIIDIMKGYHIPPLSTELALNVYLAALIANIPATKTEVGIAI